MKRSLMASRHRWIYVGAIVVLVGMLIGGLLIFSGFKSTSAANKKAQELSTKLRDAGFPTPNQGEIARTLGTDGGAVCHDPSGALNQAQWKESMSNGATGPGQRAVLADKDAVSAELLVLEVYCPDQVPEFRKKLHDLNLDDTAHE